jgi:hypothetical protein
MAIGHFDLPMQWESETWIGDPGPVYEWLTGGPAQPGAAGPVAEVAEATAGPAEDVTMEPMVITVPAARRETLLKQAGWIKINLQFIVKAYDNTPLDFHACHAQYLGPRGEEYDARSDLHGGIASFGDFWIKPQGMLRFLAVPDFPNDVFLDGSVPVPARIRDNYLAYNAVQDYREVQIRAASNAQVADQMQVQGNAKFSITGVVEVGGGASYGTTTTQGVSREMIYTVRVAANSVSITPASR